MPVAKQPNIGKVVGFSTGIGLFPDNAETIDGLVFLTDAALFHAKRGGGHQSILVSELDTLSPEILSMATRDQVYALSATVDAKDPYTYGHSNRVASVAETIAKSIGMSGKSLADVYAAAILHDIGKLGVPDVILTKPSKLTDAEWKIIHQHPAEGAKIISHVKELSTLIPLIRHHHEWYDGTGYPEGLKGDEIPLGARIISIADAYDTMTTKRLYRNVITHKEALRELKRCSGTQFDPKLVESFCKLKHNYK
jgi:putative nucleotidyltransferase with HDIG domain